MKSCFKEILMKTKKLTKGGSNVVYHDEPIRESIITRNEENIHLITEHIENHIGPISGIIHQIISENVQIDIYVIEPTQERNFYTLVTSGMSDRPMTNNQGEDFYFAELMLALPPNWKLDEDSWEDHDNYWPIQWLSTLAKLPHQYGTWLWDGHTIPNGENPIPFSDNTDFCGWAVGFPKTVSEEFILFTPTEEKTVVFFAVYPLYYNEIFYKLEEGFDNLCDLMDLNNITEIIDLNRIDVTQQ